MPDETATLDFLLHHLKRANIKNATMLEIGCGPMVINSIAIAPYVSQIHMADYLKKNLTEIKLWKRHSPAAFSWNHFTNYILKKEGKTPSQSALKNREEEARNKITRLLFCDLRHDKPLDTASKKGKKYPIVVSPYCADSITASKTTWKRYMRNLLGLVDDGGSIIIGALRNTRFYKINGDRFPSAFVNEKDLRRSLLEEGFDPKSIKIKVVATPSCSKLGFRSIMFAYGKKY